MSANEPKRTCNVAALPYAMVAAVFFQIRDREAIGDRTIDDWIAWANSLMERAPERIGVKRTPDPGTASVTINKS
jgi:hypothetical protein